MIVRPIITYGAVAWSGRTKINTARATLAKIQRLACVCITGAMRTCPTAAMEVILDLSPLHLVIEEVAKKTLLSMVKEGIGKGKALGSKEFDLLSDRI